MQEQTMGRERRQEWIDVIRAIAMLFVIYGHFYRSSTAYFVITSPIKIPLFFAISGYLFNDRNGNIKEFMQKLTMRIAVPWLCLSIVPAVAFIPFKGLGYFANKVWEILIGEQCWYMPCCIIAEILFMMCKKYTKTVWQHAIVAICLMSAGYILGQLEYMNIFKINTAMIAQGFLLIGYLLRLNWDKITTAPRKTCICAWGGYILLAIVSLLLYPGQSLDVNNNRYYNIPICLLMIVLGCYGLFSIAPSVKKYPRWLTFVGRNTLVYYMFHSYGRMVVEKLLQFIGINFPNTWYSAIAMTVIVCIGCGIGALILGQIVPEALGRKRIPKRVLYKAENNQ